MPTYLLLSICLIISAIATPLWSQEPAAPADAVATGTPPQGMRGRPVNLPDISAIGVLSGHTSDDRTNDADRNKLEFDEVETAFQGYIYPEIRADFFLALHKHDNEYEAEICEAKVGFLRLAEGLAGEAGKIHVNFGKLNRVHEHHRPMVDQPPVLTNFFGAHGLVGQGGTLSYLFPLPFYLQAEGGAWRVSAHAHTHSDDESEEPASFQLADEVYSGRLKTSFAPTKKSEIELGSSLAKGKGSHYTEHLDRSTVYGADLTFRSWPSAWSRWTFQNEWLHLHREVPVGVLDRNGLYSLLNYRLDKYWDVGGRWDYAEGAFPTDSIERALSAMVGYHLTETSELRLAYKRRNVNGQDINEGWLRFTFGIGPHSHELE